MLNSTGSNWQRTYLIRAVATDAVAMAAASGITLAIGPQSLSDELFLRDGTVTYGVAALIGIALWMGVAVVLGAYDREVLGDGTEEFLRVFRTTFGWVLLVAVITFAGVIQMSRGMVALVAVIGTLAVLAARDANRRWLHDLRMRGLATYRVVACGSTARIAELREHLERAPWAGYQVVASVSGNASGVVEPAELLAEIRRAGADAVAITDTDHLGSDGLRSLAEQLEGSRYELFVVPALTDVAGPRIGVRPLAGLPLLHLREPRLTGVARVVKEVIDKVLALAGLLVLALPFLVIALLVRLTSPGPALFRQRRVGRDGRVFTVVKFRSMVDGAEDLRGELAELNEFDGPLFKMREDPRITPFGRWLRRHSIDELPQLLNVLRGTMSLVGPRPMLESEYETLAERAKRRFLVKPGITGLWQVSGRSELSWDDVVRLDLYYVENWSLSLDLVILLRTANAVIRGRGAF